jgi:Na+/H+ antiporter NhaD/arsenite permease-like protein
MAIVASLIFLAALALIALEWLHRTKVALVGAGLMVVIGIISEERAIAAVDWGTLGLLVGMMVVVGVSEQTGFFTYLALRSVQLSRGSPFRLLFLLAGVTGVLSAFLDNLTAILLVVPITLLIGDRLGVTPLPLVLVEVFAANIGGTATLIGDPPNIMIGTHVRRLGFVEFAANLAPVAVVTLLAVTAIVYLLYRRRLAPSPDSVAAVVGLDPAEEMRGSEKVGRILATLGGTIVLFFLHGLLHLEPAVVALLGATVMLVLSGSDVEQALQRVQWSTIIFFVGLFVMVGGLERRGVIGHVADLIANATSGSRVGEAMMVLWGAAVGSALVDNIPFTAAMIPVVDTLQSPQASDTNWWALALGACFGGNATIVAAAANVAASGVLERSGRAIGFARFLAVGVPVTLLSLLIASAYLLVFHL